MKRKVSQSQSRMQTRMQQQRPQEDAGRALRCDRGMPSPSPSPSPPPAPTPTPPESSATTQTTEASETTPAPDAPRPARKPLEITAEHVRELSYLLEQVARRVLDNEKLLKTTASRLAELETAVSVQRTTQTGFAHVLDGHKRAIGALGGRHNEQEHSIVAARASLEEQAEEIAALHALIAQDFVGEAVESLESPDV